MNSEFERSVVVWTGSRITTICILVSGLLLPGCQRYQAHPLDPELIVHDVDHARQLTSDSAARQPFTFSRAVELTSKYSPALLELRAEYQTALALSKVKTPLPNPAFEVGPRYGFGSDVAVTNRLQPFGSLGFAVPTGGRLKRQDELNRLQTELAYIQTSARQRELYLELRKQYARLVFGRAKLAGRKLSEESTDKSLTLSKRIAEAGQATALDTNLLELDLARSKTDVIGAKTEIAEIEGALSGIIGVHADYFSDIPQPAMPDLPVKPPTLQELRETLISNHPEQR